MRKLTAICLGWSAFIYGCSAATTAEETVPAATTDNGTETSDIAPANALLVPILPCIDTNIVFPPLTLPPVEAPATPEETPATPEETPVVSETPVSNVPTQFEGNPTCAEAFGEPDILELKLEQARRGGLADGNYASADGKISVTIDFSHSSLDYASGGGVIGVIVKGGTYANAYVMTTTSGSNLVTPGGEQISHVTFCYLP